MENQYIFIFEYFNGNGTIETRYLSFKKNNGHYKKIPTVVKKLSKLCIGHKEELIDIQNNILGIEKFKIKKINMNGDYEG